MATFISLISLTQRGEEQIKNTVDRSQAFRDAAERAGATVKEVYWTLGSYDGVVIFDAPDGETAAALILGLESRGSVRAQTLRAFDSSQMQGILDRVG